MILISHRGNIDGAKPELENKPSYIEAAIDAGYDVEVDLRVKDGKLYLGHDEPQYQVDFDWLQKYRRRLWLHCKDIKVIEVFHRFDRSGVRLNYFWHETDTLTLTSQGHLWAYPGIQPVAASIAVMPELNNDSIEGCVGVCSDVIKNYKPVEVSTVQETVAA